MVHAYQQGKLKHAPKKIRDTAGSISEEDSGHFARTKHEGLPEKVALYLEVFSKEAGLLGLLGSGARAVGHGAVGTLKYVGMPALANQLDKWTGDADDIGAAANSNSFGNESTSGKIYNALKSTGLFAGADGLVGGLRWAGRGAGFGATLAADKILGDASNTGKLVGANPNSFSNDTYGGQVYNNLKLMATGAAAGGSMAGGWGAAAGAAGAGVKNIWNLGQTIAEIHQDRADTASSNMDLANLQAQLKAKQDFIGPHISQSALYRLQHPEGAAPAGTPALFGEHPWRNVAIGAGLGAGLLGLHQLLSPKPKPKPEQRPEEQQASQLQPA